MNPGPCPCLGSVWKFLHGTRLFIWSLYWAQSNFHAVWIYHKYSMPYSMQEITIIFRGMPFENSDCSCSFLIEIFHKNMQLVCHACNAIGWMCADVQFKIVGYSNWKTSHVTNLNLVQGILQQKIFNKYVSLRLRVQNAVCAQPCVGKFRISLVLLNFLHCNFRLWFETP